LIEITAVFSSDDFTATSPHIFNRLLLYCRLNNGVEIHFDQYSICPALSWYYGNTEQCWLLSWSKNFNNRPYW